MTSIPRVMLLAPQFWISGTVTLAREMQIGWPTYWPAPKIACATKSGKSSTQWGRPANQIRRATSTSWRPDITGSVEDIIRIARESFDMVHVTEPDIPASHRDWWHSLLEKLPVPWTLTLNGNTYPDVRWNRIIKSKNFLGVVWSTPGHVPPELCESSHVQIIRLPRPYTVRHQIDRRVLGLPLKIFDGELVVGTHCRIAPDKGVALVCALSKHLGANVCIDGAPQAGAVPYSLTLQRYYLPEDLRSDRAEDTWIASTDTGGRLRFNGAFSDGIEIAKHHNVHMSGTRLGFSAGHEYSILEAIDAGCVIVQPKHMVEPGCNLHQYTYEWTRQGVVGALNNEHRELSHAVSAALEDAAHGYDQTFNRKAIAWYHSPERLLGAFMTYVLNRL